MWLGHLHLCLRSASPPGLVGTAEPTHRVSQSSVNPDCFFGNFGISLENWHHLHYFGIIYTTLASFTLLSKFTLVFRSGWLRSATGMRNVNMSVSALTGNAIFIHEVDIRISDFGPDQRARAPFRR